MDQDEQNLSLLSVFHYIMAGGTALFACIPIIHVAVGVLMLTGRFDGADPPPVFFGWMFVLFGGAFVLLGWILAILTAIAGARLKQRRARVFCIVVAAIQCLNMPVGTVLGVFTLVTLSRPTVIAMFDGGPPPPH
jgi:hypothetical protein